MLHKETIVNLIITNVVISLFKNFKTLKVCWVEMWVHFEGGMHQNIDLEVIPIHILHLTLCFECIILQEVDAKEDYVIKNVFQQKLEFLDSVTSCKYLKFV
jgi:hypothetical protein